MRVKWLLLAGFVVAACERLPAKSAAPLTTTQAVYAELAIGVGNCVAADINASGLLGEPDTVKTYAALREAGKVCEAFASRSAAARPKLSGPGHAQLDAAFAACGVEAQARAKKLKLQAVVVNGDQSPKAIYDAREADSAVDADECRQAESAAEAAVGFTAGAALK